MATGRGGALHLTSCNSTLTDITADSNGAVDGGAVAFAGGEHVLSGTTLTLNVGRFVCQSPLPSCAYIFHSSLQCVVEMEVAFGVPAARK